MDGNGSKKPSQIAVLLYPGVTALDAVGPWEALSRMSDTGSSAEKSARS
jgi:putative intracellular protease/amidase